MFDFTKIFGKDNNTKAVIDYKDIYDSDEEGYKFELDGEHFSYFGIYYGAECYNHFSYFYALSEESTIQLKTLLYPNLRFTSSTDKGLWFHRDLFQNISEDLNIMNKEFEEDYNYDKTFFKLLDKISKGETSNSIDYKERSHKFEIVNIPFLVNNYHIDLSTLNEDSKYQNLEFSEFEDDKKSIPIHNLESEKVDKIIDILASNFENIKLDVKPNLLDAFGNLPDDILENSSKPIFNLLSQTEYGGEYLLLDTHYARCFYPDDDNLEYYLDEISQSKAFEEDYYKNDNLVMIIRRIGQKLLKTDTDNKKVNKFFEKFVKDAYLEYIKEELNNTSDNIPTTVTIMENWLADYSNSRLSKNQFVHTLKAAKKLEYANSFDYIVLHFVSDEKKIVDEDDRKLILSKHKDDINSVIEMVIDEEGGIMTKTKEEKIEYAKNMKEKL